jgi:ABC-type uncharacterized transport system substrate-binding protein
VTPFVAALGAWTAVAAPPARAHPHVFIDYTTTLVFGERGLEGLRFTWVFDEMYSTVLRVDFVKGDPTKLPPQTVKAIRERAFANLANFNYFLEIRVDDSAPIKIDRIADFDVRFVQGRAVYQFTVPVDWPAGREPSSIEIAAFDPDFYVDYILSDSRPFGMERAERFDVKCDAQRGVERNTAGWGVVRTDRVACSYRGSS